MVEIEVVQDTLVGFRDVCSRDKGQGFQQPNAMGESWALFMDLRNFKNVNQDNVKVFHPVFLRHNLKQFTFSNFQKI